MQTADTPLFEIVSYKDLFKKAEHDLAKLDKLVNSYDLFNYLCTINHLYDWVEQETGTTPPREKDGCLDTVRLLCNRAKHFRKIKCNEKGRVLEVAPDTSVQKGFGYGRIGVGLFGVGEPSYTVTINDEDLQILQLCKETFEIWDTFLKTSNLMN